MVSQGLESEMTPFLFMRVLLDEDDFKSLVSGEIIERDGVLIALQDIGYDLMLSIINTLREELIIKQAKFQDEQN